jgi:hypothetical protein
MAQVAGIVKVYLNGQLQRAKEGVKLITGGKERTMQVGHSVHGYSEKVIPSTLEMVISLMADTKLEDLNNLTDATVRVETDIGLSYLCTGMSVTKPVEFTGGEGDVSIEMMGDPAVEE